MKALITGLMSGMVAWSCTSWAQAVDATSSDEELLNAYRDGNATNAEILEAIRTRGDVARSKRNADVLGTGFDGASIFVSLPAAGARVGYKAAAEVGSKIAQAMVERRESASTDWAAIGDHIWADRYLRPEDVLDRIRADPEFRELQPGDVTTMPDKCYYESWRDSIECRQWTGHDLIVNVPSEELVPLLGVPSVSSEPPTNDADDYEDNDPFEGFDQEVEALLEESLSETRVRSGASTLPSSEIEEHRRRFSQRTEAAQAAQPRQELGFGELQALQQQGRAWSDTLTESSRVSVPEDRPYTPVRRTTPIQRKAPDAAGPRRGTGDSCPVGHNCTVP